jgi:hypothetical protein
MPKMRLLTQRGRRVTERVDQYQRNAEKCLELAGKFNDPDAKRIMSFMANAWLLLAAQRAKSIETAPANEPPPLRLNPAKPDDPVQS